mgnify:CR=1 FL=1|tara:strand:+ start:7265 stop:7579 length:315 start_codon:yes stop_codon:yes gene_type:complete
MKIKGDNTSIYFAFNDEEIAKINKVGFIQIENANRKHFLNMMMGLCVELNRATDEEFANLLSKGDTVEDKDSTNKNEIKRVKPENITEEQWQNYLKFLQKQKKS